MYKLIFAAVLGLSVASSSVATASVVIDDFSSSSSTTIGGLTRTSFGSASYSSSTVFSGFASTGFIGGVQYSAGPDTFGDVVGTESENGFSVGTASFGSSFLLTVLGNEGGDVELYHAGIVTDGLLTVDADFSQANTLTFLFLRLGGSGTALLGGGGTTATGAFSAVPEPTSLILVGIACCPLAMLRRRSTFV